MDVAVTGSSGLVGSALLAALRAQGHRPLRVVRPGGTAGPDTLVWDPAAGTIDAGGLEGIDAVVHLAGEGLASRRWSDAHKRRLVASRTAGTGLLARTLARLAHPPRVMVSASAIGYYGDRGDEVLDESSAPGSGFLAELCQAWEAAAAPAEEAGVVVPRLRTGIVLSPRGGALAKQLPLFRLGLGGRFGSGRQWQSWISLDDEVAAIVHLLGATQSGPRNLTAPHPVTNAEFTRTLARVLHRPAVLPIPRVGPALVLGGELVDNLLYGGQRVLPTRLQEEGFAFGHPTLEEALRALLDRPAPAT